MDAWATAADRGVGLAMVGVNPAHEHNQAGLYASRFPRARVVGLEPDQPSIELAREALARTDLDDLVELRCLDQRARRR